MKARAFNSSVEGTTMLPRDSGAPGFHGSQRPPVSVPPHPIPVPPPHPIVVPPPPPHVAGVPGPTTGHVAAPQLQPHRYQFTIHQHPLVVELMRALIHGGIANLVEASVAHVKGSTIRTASGATVPRPKLYQDSFARDYQPGHGVAEPYPVHELDFDVGGAYSVYNWELFYHIPMAVAAHLSQNGAFKEAKEWYELIFNPRGEGDQPAPQRFWKIPPFQVSAVQSLDKILLNLATGADPKLKESTQQAIDGWIQNPFRPFLVARFRPSAFMTKAVTAYLDNLIAWGDRHFARYSSDSINQAEVLYSTAARILGPKPQPVPRKDSARPETYASLRGKLDALGNALVEVESELPFDLSSDVGVVADHSALANLGILRHSLYFCTPHNERFYQYWDTVGDRLFKIRNSLNMQGVFQRPALFEPPIDPALLVRGVAAGLDISAIVEGANQPLPLVRFAYLLQKAQEACQEVKSLGANLLAAIEKKDNEALAIMRARHETTVLGLAESVRYGALQEATKNREALEQSLRNASARYSHYQQMLGKQPGDVTIPTLESLDKGGLAQLRLNANEPSLAAEAVKYDVQSGEDGIPLSSHEAKELDSAKTAYETQQGAKAVRALAAVLRVIPDIRIHGQPLGIGTTVKAVDGAIFADVANFAAEIVGMVADSYTYESQRAGRMAAFDNRQRDYQFQSETIAGEITQIFKQLRAAQIREAVAEREWKNHQQQIKHAKEVEDFLTDERKGKISNADFYSWMKREVKRLYDECFRFALDLSRKAERALRAEIGDPSLNFVQVDYLSGKEGLLAGEKLHFDVRKMEAAYADLNLREYELVKHVSLKQTNPAGLIQLRAKGSCTLSLPEEIFDFDCPGHYFRRIRAVAVSVPSVVGPYVGLNLRLTLSKSSIRTTAVPGSAYTRDGADDIRFSDHLGSAESMVTSSGLNDAGMFEDGRDDRRRHFELAGAISEWRIDLPAGIRQFDYSTISDVILHVRYTAREGGDGLRNVAVKNLERQIDEGSASGCVRLFSLRHEFSTEWAKWKSARPGEKATLSFTLAPEHYPFWSQGRVGAVLKCVLFANAKKEVQLFENADGSGGSDVLRKDANLGGLFWCTTKNVPSPAPIGPWALHLSDNTLGDLWMVVSWGKKG
jgi:hypothetical protein